MFAENSRHMFSDCPERFWSQVANIVTDLLEVFIPCLPHTLLLNDDSTITLPFYQKEALLPSLELLLQKKMLVLRWKPPHRLCINK